MLINKHFDIKEYDPYIKTEETTFNLLIRDKDTISNEYELVPIPLAHWINTIGIPKTNSLISQVVSAKKRIFICQHIYVNYLKFRDTDIVFTPHSFTNDKFISIPHYAVNINDNINKDRDKLFSFMGSTTTHTTRKSLVKNYPSNCFDTNIHWGLDTNMTTDFKTNYINLLNDSIFSICPRGTGISSVRLFESMAMGCIPIVVADNYEYPLSDIIDWNKISIQVPEFDIIKDNGIAVNNKIDNFIKQNDTKEVKTEVLNIYNTYFSNDKLHKTILYNL